jgi:hypothetical protein
MAFNAMDFKRRNFDPCLCFKNSEKYDIAIWILWVEDCLLIGHKEEVSKEKNMMQQYFECEDIGELKEYVGFKIERNKNIKSLKMSQPVIIRSFEVEFGANPDFSLKTSASHDDTLFQVSKMII